MTDLPDDRPRPRSRVVYGSISVELRRQDRLPMSPPWIAHVDGGRWSADGYGSSALVALGNALESMGHAIVETCGAHAVRSLGAAVGVLLSEDQALDRWRRMPEDERANTLDTFAAFTKTRP